MASAVPPADASVIAPLRETRYRTQGQALPCPHQTLGERAPTPPAAVGWAWGGAESPCHQTPSANATVRKGRRQGCHTDTHTELAGPLPALPVRRTAASAGAALTSALATAVPDGGRGAHVVRLLDTSGDGGARQLHCLVELAETA